MLGTAPKISVVIPTFRPDLDLLRTTLLSVLRQDPGPDVLEIDVVDDASPDHRPDELVRELGAGRIRLSRQPKNLGLARNWNSCLQRARGEWAHFLHQDDFVHPGFYHALRDGLQNPNVAVAFCRHAFVDAEGRVIGHSDLERPSPGVVDDFLKRIASGQRIQFSSALLRRSACLEAGGFDESLAYALDWEMWARLASRHAVWFEPRVLACFRVHEKSTGWYLAKGGVAVRDHVRAMRLINSYVPPEARRDVRRMSVEHVADMAKRLVDHGAVAEGIRCGLECLWLSRTSENFLAFLRLTRRALFPVARLT